MTYIINDRLTLSNSYSIPAKEIDILPLKWCQHLVTYNAAVKHL